MKKITVFFIVLMLITLFSYASIGDDIQSGEVKQYTISDYNNPKISHIPGCLPPDYPLLDKQISSQNNLPHHNLQIQSTSDEIIEMIQQLDTDIILSYLENLTDFGPRVTGTDECNAAGNYIYNEFKDMGLDVRFHNWSHYGYDDRNIEATYYGTSETSDEIYIICGHYDSVPGSPGADDDGSGVAALMATAKILSQFTFNHTIRFITFSGEEQGLLGSHKYVEDASGNEDNIIAVFNADMIGYAISKFDGDNIKIYEDDFSEWITDFMDDISVQYNDYINLNIIPSGYTWGSDHYSFWEFGYSAIFAHEYKFNPYYHSFNDTINNMNLTYFKKATKLLLASLAELAKNGVNSTAPNAPVISGPTIGEPDVLYNFTFNSIDQNNDRIYYYIDWGDGEIEEWIGPFDSGEEQNIYHSWSEKGLYSIKAKTKDTYNLESSWETLKINIPRKKVINKNVILENILILLNKLLNSKIL